MTNGFTQNQDDTLSDQLAAAAGAGELAAAAALDAEEGDRFLRALLADQMAAAHLLAMRMAAASDRAIDAAADVSRGTSNLPLFDLAAARFAGAAARLNGRYGRSLQTLRALAGPADAAEEIEWVGFNPPMNGEYELLPGERARRINREIFYRKLNQTWPESDRAASARRRSLDAAEQARLAAAGSAARDLLAATGVEALAGPSNAQQTRLFAHQLAAAHRLMMRLSGRADIVVTAAGDPLDHPEGLRLAHGAARLMERFRQGVAMLRRLRTGPDAPRRVENFWSGPLSDDEFEEERQDDISHGLDPDTGLPSEAPLGAKGGLPAGASAAAAGLSAGLVRPSPEGEGGRSAGESGGSTEAGVLLRRGRLNNGNPGGDFLAAPRCGACTRAGCSCRQPAMANGRCRFHGGKSTGPRTQAGRARARRNRVVHGLRSAEMIALTAAAAAAHRRLGALLAAARSRSDRKDPKRHTLVSPRRKPGSIFQRPVSMDPGFRRGDTRELEQSKTRTPAGHGVDRSESNASATILPFPRPNPARSPRRDRRPRVRS